MTPGVSRYLLLESGQSLQLPNCDSSSVPDENLFMLIRGDACRLWNQARDAGLRQKLVGQVVREGYTGRGWCVLLKIAAATVEVWESERPGLKHGEVVELAVNVQRVQLFPARLV